MVSYLPYRGNKGVNKRLLSKITLPRCSSINHACIIHCSGYLTLLALSIVLTPSLYDITVYMVRMCRSIQSVLVVVCVVTLSHHIQLGKSQDDGKCKKKKQYHCVYMTLLIVILLQSM